MPKIMTIEKLLIITFGIGTEIYITKNMNSIVVTSEKYPIFGFGKTLCEAIMDYRIQRRKNDSKLHGES